MVYFQYFQKSTLDYLASGPLIADSNKRAVLIALLCVRAESWGMARCGVNLP